MKKIGKQRLDTLLVARRHFDSREKAKRAIMAGLVRVGETVADKAGTQFSNEAVISVAATDRYVGRGALKLEAALQKFQIDPTGKICLDIGASTGGFTDCLLQHGAEKVYAVDVGHSQLDWKIRQDQRVIVFEKLNARYITNRDIPEPIDLCVIDVSFISLTMILPAVADLVKSDGSIIALIKPQFELSREEVGKGGIVREIELHDKSVNKIVNFSQSADYLEYIEVIDSPIFGTEGNKEFLIWLKKSSES